jgi:hypothetical protein
MSSKKFYVDLDLNKNELLNVRLHPLSTQERLQLGATLSAQDESMVVYDTDLATIFFWDGIQWVAMGTGSGSDANYVHDQTTPASIWIVDHNLGKFTAVSVVDSAGTEVEGDVDYLSLNTVRLTFSSPFSGKAYFN